MDEGRGCGEGVGRTRCCFVAVVSTAHCHGAVCGGSLRGLVCMPPVCVISVSACLVSGIKFMGCGAPGRYRSCTVKNVSSWQACFMINGEERLYETP